MNRQLTPLFLAQALAVGATTSSLVLGSIIAAQLGLEALAGLPSTFNTFAAALSAYPFGQLMSRAGWRFGLISAYLLGAFGAVIGFYGASQGSFVLFLVGCALMGSARGGAEQGRYAAASLASPERRASTLSVLLFMSVIGSALAALLAPVLSVAAPHLGVTSEVLGWLVAAGLLVMSALFTLWWRAGGKQDASVVARGGARLAWQDTTVRVAALSMGVAQGVMVTLMVLSPLRAHHLGMHHAGVAGLLTLHFVGMFGFAWLVGRLVDRAGPRSGLVLGSMLFVVASALLPLVSGVALAVSLFTLGLGWNLCYIAASSLLATKRDVQGSVDALAYLSAGLGAIGGSLIAAHYGFGVLAVLGATLGILPAFASLSLKSGSPAAATD